MLTRIEGTPHSLSIDVSADTPSDAKRFRVGAAHRARRSGSCKRFRYAVLLLLKEFRLVGFDPEFAAAEGFAVDRIDLAMMALVVAVTVMGLRAVGLILVVALLIIPPAAARFWTERLSLMAMLAALFGGISGYLGAAASALLPRFPAGVSSSSSPVRSSS
jgi:ABC-type Mn2+/Zn2+ transport system permease subunit